MVWDGIEIANSLDVVASIERHSLQGANMFRALVDRAKLVLAARAVLQRARAGAGHC